MIQWLRAALDLALPRVCPPCDTALPPGARSILCPACTGALVRRLPDAWPCGTPPSFLSARALGPYIAGPPGNVLARAIQHLKYRGARALAAPLAELLAVHYPFDGRGLVVPVPLHVSRLRARGYNQAALLACGLARRRGLPVATRLLVRTRATMEHATLGAAARRANVRDAFRVRAGPCRALDTVILVDDVLTTGATADACTRALRAAGARTVHVYTVGRTP